MARSAPRASASPAPRGETGATVRTPHSPGCAREPHGEEPQSQRRLGPGLSAASAGSSPAAGDSSLAAGEVSAVSGSPGSRSSATPELPRGRMARPALSPRPSQRLAPSSAAWLFRRRRGGARARAALCARGGLSFAALPLHLPTLLWRWRSASSLLGFPWPQLTRRRAPLCCGLARVESSFPGRSGPFSWAGLQEVRRVPFIYWCGAIITSPSFVKPSFPHDSLPLNQGG